MARAMESRALLVDVSVAMGDDLAIAKRALLAMAQQKMIQMPTKSRMGLVMMGSTDTKHDMTNGDGSMLDGYDNVCTVKPVEQTDTLLLNAINSLRKEESECNYVSGLTVVMDLLLRDGVKGKQDRGIVLVTNAKSEFDPADQEMLSHVQASMKRENISLTVFVPRVKIAAHASVTFLKIRTSGINFSASDDEDTWTGSETMLRQLVYDCGGELKVVQGETEFRAHSVKSVNPVTLFRGELEFTPHLKVKVWAFPHTKMQSQPSLKQRPIGTSSEGVLIERKTVLVEDRDKEVEPENITKAFKYGRTQVPVGEEDVREMKYETERTMKLLGTVERKDIRQHFLLSNADVVVKDKDCPVSGKMLSALVQALANTDRVAIVTWVKRAGSPPKIYGLYPYVNKPDGVYGFHAVQLPFTDDLRRQALSSLDKAGKAPSEEQLDMARRIVEKASLLDGCGNLILQSTAMPNPVIQNFHQTVIDKVLLSKAMKEQTDFHASSSEYIAKLLKPDDKVWVKLEKQASKVNDTFKVEWKVESDDGRAASAAATGDLGAAAAGSGEPALKKQRTDGEGVSVKKEVKEEPKDEYEQIEFAKALGDGSRGSDAIAEFESKWIAGDRDTAIHEMMQRICELVDKTTDDDRPLLKAIGHLGAVREKCDAGMSNESVEFNRVWDELDRKYRDHQSIKFWDKVLAKGTELSKIPIEASESEAVLLQPSQAVPAAGDAVDDMDDFE